MEIIAHITNVITDEVVGDVAAEKSHPFGQKIWDLIGKICGRKPALQKIQYHAESVGLRLTRPLVWPRPMQPFLAAMECGGPLGMVRQNLARGVNNPVLRNTAIAGLIMGAAAVVGYGWPVMLASAGSAFALKFASSEMVGVLAWCWRRYVRRDWAKTQSIGALWQQTSWRSLPQHICRVTFSTSQKNLTLNALDMMLTVCSGLLLLPLVAQIQTSFWQNIGGRTVARGIGRTTANLTLQETMVAADAAVTPALRSTGVAFVEQTSLTRMGWGRMMQLVQDLPERLLTTGEQAATKFLGHQLARQQALRELAM